MSLNKEGVLTNRVCTIWAARVYACDMCCFAPVISCFCPRRSQPASNPATSHPTGTSLLLGQRLSKKIILLFLTLFSSIHLYFSLSLLLRLLPPLHVRRPLPWRPSHRHSLQHSGLFSRLSDTLEDEPPTPTPQDKFINLLQLSVSSKRKKPQLPYMF